MNLPLLKNANVDGKTVFLRADLDAPIKYQISNIKDQKDVPEIEDDTRLKAALPTLDYLLKHGAKVIIAGHLGRPVGLNQELRSKNYELSLRPVAGWFAEHIHNSSFMLHDSKLGEFAGWEIGQNISVLENLRFYEGEEKNDPEFSKKLASLADVYVNDAFAVCHRNHASIVGIPKFLPHFAGLHLEEEINHLSSVLKNPKRPLVVIIGGKKIETKLPLVIKMYSLSDYVLVGGKIAEESKEFIKIEHQKSKSKALLLVADLNSDGNGILENSIENFIEVINRAKMVIWNGSMGKISQKLEEDDFNHATRRIAQAIIKSRAYSVVGGGDTTEFLRAIGLIDKFNFVSTGGGAMLALLSGEKLPGPEALLR